MPTMDDLGKLASQLYKGGRWAQDAATSLGITSPGFWLWSNEEYKYNDYFDGYYVYVREFAAETTSYFGERFDSYGQAVCLGD